MHIDLEYNKKSNPEMNDETNEALLDEFIYELGTEIKDTFNIDISRKCIVDLDSSTVKKFSRHFIVHLPNGELFADTFACGVFVKNFVGRLAEEVATGELRKRCPVLADFLFVNCEETKEKLPQKGKASSQADNTDRSISSDNLTPEMESSSQSNIKESKEVPSGEEQQATETKMSGTSRSDTALAKSTPTMPINQKTCFVDTGVYTRNRLFRLMGSSKYGKPVSAALRISPFNKFPFPEEFDNSKFFVPDIEKVTIPERSDDKTEVISLSQKFD